MSSLHEAIITLTPLGGTKDVVRTITLNHTRPVVRIGRSSKTIGKDIAAASNNAWLDSPVVSRIHGEIRLINNKLPDTINLDSDDDEPSTPSYWQSIKITDLGSLHGTFLNNSKLRLTANQPADVRSGTVITFGTNVLRGNTHFHPQHYTLTYSIQPSLPTPDSRSPQVANRRFGIDAELWGDSDSDNPVDIDYAPDEDEQLADDQSDLELEDPLEYDESNDDTSEFDNHDFKNMIDLIVPDNYPLNLAPMLPEPVDAGSDLDEVDYDPDYDPEASDAASDVADVGYDSEEEPVTYSNPRAAIEAINRTARMAIAEDIPKLPKQPTEPAPTSMDPSLLLVVQNKQADVSQSSLHADSASQVFTPTSGQQQHSGEASTKPVPPSRNRISIDNILNSVTAADFTPGKRKFADIDDLPSAQPQDFSQSSVSLPQTPEQAPKRAKTSSGFLRTAGTALLGAVVGGISVFAALAASAPEDF